MDQAGEAVDQVADEALDLFENGEETAESNEFDFDNASSEEEINYDEIDQKLEVEEKPAQVQSAPTVVSDNSDYEASSNAPSNSNSYGDFLVITGSYLVRSNAENMTRKLAQMGYQNSEIVVFDNSQYNSVIASRKDSYASALESANALKRKGIDAYVHRKK